MSEYIEKEAVINFIENGLNNPDKTKSFGHDAIEIMAEVRYMPAADVVEVRRGTWIGELSVTTSANKGRTIRSTIYKCSLCNKTNGRIKKPYCPNCGAKMDGDTE